MAHHDMTPRNPGPVPESAQRPVVGQPDYYWGHWLASIARVVYRRDGQGVPVGTVRPNRNGHALDMTTAWMSYDADGEEIEAGAHPSQLVELVALCDRAGRLAAEHAIAEAARAMADSAGEVGIDEYRRCVTTAGEPEWDNDYLRPGVPLSGHDDDLTPRTLLQKLGVDPDRIAPGGTVKDVVAWRYGQVFNAVWRRELPRLAQEHIDRIEQAEPE